MHGIIFQVKICRLYVPEDTEMTSIGLDEDLEAGIMALERISASCSPLTVSSYHKSTDPDGLDDPEVSPGLVASTIVNVLKLVLASNEVLPLVHSLIDGLGDECPASARGVSLVLTAILEVRGHEVKVTTSLLPKLHAMLASGAMQEDTRSQTLMAVRILTSHNKIEVVEAFLNEQQKLPFDRPLVSFFLHFPTVFIFYTPFRYEFYGPVATIQLLQFMGQYFRPYFVHRP